MKNHDGFIPKIRAYYQLKMVFLAFKTRLKEEEGKNRKRKRGRERGGRGCEGG